jgi:hypothetical protein
VFLQQVPCVLLHPLHLLVLCLEQIAPYSPALDKGPCQLTILLPESQELRVQKCSVYMEVEKCSEKQNGWLAVTSL